MVYVGLFCFVVSAAILHGHKLVIQSGLLDVDRNDRTEAYNQSKSNSMDLTHLHEAWKSQWAAYVATNPYVKKSSDLYSKDPGANWTWRNVSSSSSGTLKLLREAIDKHKSSLTCYPYAYPDIANTTTAVGSTVAGEDDEGAAGEDEEEGENHHGRRLPLNHVNGKNLYHCSCTNCCLYKEKVFVFDGEAERTKLRVPTGSVSSLLDIYHVSSDARNWTSKSGRRGSKDFAHIASIDGEVELVLTNDDHSVWVSKPTHIVHAGSVLNHPLFVQIMMVSILDVWNTMGWVGNHLKAASSGEQSTASPPTPTTVDFNWALLQSSVGVERLNDWWMNFHPEQKPVLRTHYRDVANMDTPDVATRMEMAAAASSNSKTAACFSELTLGAQPVGDPWIVAGSNHYGPIVDEAHFSQILNRNRENAFDAAWNRYYQFSVESRGLKDNAKLSPNQVILISRNDARSRRTLNEGSLVDLLTAEGFNVTFLYFGDYIGQSTALHKVLHTAPLVMGAHGAGFANLFGVNQEAVVMEWHMEPFQRIIFAKIAVILGLDYRHFMIKKEYLVPTPLSNVSIKDPDYWRNRDVYINLEEMKAALQPIKITLKGKGLFF